MANFRNNFTVCSLKRLPELMKNSLYWRAKKIIIIFIIVLLLLYKQKNTTLVPEVFSLLEAPKARTSGEAKPIVRAFQSEKTSGTRVQKHEILTSLPEIDLAKEDNWTCTTVKRSSRSFRFDCSL